VAENPADPHNAWLRQVLTYWEMAAAMVLHGAVSAELFVDCNAEGFFMLAKFAPILDGIREKNPGFLMKTAELVNRFSAAPNAMRRCSRTWKPGATVCRPGKRRTGSILTLRSPDRGPLRNSG
jgi:hypothetical protein